MTNQVNQDERNIAMQEAYQIHDSDEYFKARPQLECDDRRKVFYAGHIRGYQAATKTRDSEINSLKQRVAELSELLKDRQSDLDFEFNRAEQNELECNALIASNNQLREALEKTLSRPKLQNEIDEILSSTPAQSLADHDNAIYEQIANELDKHMRTGVAGNIVRAMREMKATNE